MEALDELREERFLDPVPLPNENRIRSTTGTRAAVEQLAGGHVRPLHFRRQLDTLVRAVQGATLVRSGAPTAELHIRRHLVPGYDPERDPEYLDLIEDRAVELAH